MQNLSGWIIKATVDQRHYVPLVIVNHIVDKVCNNCTTFEYSTIGSDNRAVCANGTTPNESQFKRVPCPEVSLL